MTQKEAYETLLRLCEKQGADLNQFSFDIQGHASEEDFNNLRRIVAYIMGYGHRKAYESIARDVPELTPDWMKGP
ncbi:hypothetical protein [Mesorhizobium sp. LSJC264A00]|uniref:hypothetical protein n=1 Tax=unclassified Mesorhizobium TaxID=325217 RepID=UPI0003CDD741|nr:hypothetical protein [Mesorhizobium sp. LSJC264A00]ESX15372.1 hypothetical protein X767_28595 [Mesorhizobium sp. LSJC264A00]